MFSVGFCVYGGIRWRIEIRSLGPLSQGHPYRQQRRVHESFCRHIVWFTLDLDHRCLHEEKQFDGYWYGDFDIFSRSPLQQGPISSTLRIGGEVLQARTAWGAFPHDVPSLTTTSRCPC
jgi:hypothetical protein